MMAQIKTAALALTSGILLALALAGPTIAYVVAVRAPEDVIRDNHRSLAEAVQDQAFSSSILAYSHARRGDLPEMNSCELDLSEAADKKAEIAVELVRDIILASDSSQQAAVRKARFDSSPLNRLSWSRLAVLKGCLDASIFAPLCKQHVRELQLGMPTLQERAVDDRADEHRCAVAAYLKPRL